MQPRYVTVVSSGGTTSVSAWFPVDWWRNPFSLGVSIVGSSILSSQAHLEVTVDDPTGQYPNPLSTTFSFGGTSSSPFVSVISAVNLSIPAVASSGVSMGPITMPIAAWRLNNTSSAGSATATVLQAGPR